jgi:very-short-patch-repair endonuclease
MRRHRPLAPRTDLEARLWARLRELDGYRFRRRAPFRTFTLDFVEHDARLVISLEAGAPGSRSPVHIVRDRLLNEQGYVILRLWREEAMRDLAGAIQRVRSVLADLSASDSD